MQSLALGARATASKLETCGTARRRGVRVAFPVGRGPDESHCRLCSHTSFAPSPASPGQFSAMAYTMLEIDSMIQDVPVELGIRANVWSLAKETSDALGLEQDQVLSESFVDPRYAYLSVVYVWIRSLKESYLGCAKRGDAWTNRREVWSTAFKAFASVLKISERSTRTPEEQACIDSLMGQQSRVHVLFDDLDFVVASVEVFGPYLFCLVGPRCSRRVEVLHAIWASAGETACSSCVSWRFFGLLDVSLVDSLAELAADDLEHCLQTKHRPKRGPLYSQLPQSKRFQFFLAVLRQTPAVVEHALPRHLNGEALVELIEQMRRKPASTGAFLTYLRRLDAARTTMDAATTERSVRELSLIHI